MHSDEHIEEIDAYEKDVIDNMTLNDSLILVALCAAKDKAGSDGIRTNDAEQIAALAQKHPIFDGCEDSIELSINKLSNLLSSKTDIPRLVQTAAEVLTPELRKAAFDWVSVVIKSDGDLTRERRILLDHYGTLLKCDDYV